MRRTGVAILIVVLVWISPVVCLSQSQPIEKEMGSASGFVLLEVEARPIRHAHVEFLNPSTGWASSVLTDDKGRFELSRLSAATYQVDVTAPGCDKLETTLKVDGIVGPLLWRLHKVAQPATPRNRSVVSIQEMRMSEKAESAFAKGTRLLQKGEVEASLRHFQRAISKEPDYFQAYHNLGLAHYWLGETAQAEQDFQKSIDLANGGFAPSQFALAMILCEKQEFQRAEKVIENGLAMDPGSAVGKYFLGVVQFALNRTEEAEKSAHDALWRNAGEADAHILLAKIHERNHKPEAVMADVAAYLKLDPHGPLENAARQLLQRAQLEITQSIATSH
jgi:tetratricopeptide (TPR) repeat protein